MNPVQFKVSSVENLKTEVKGMTVFNTEQVNTKKQPMFFGKPLGIQRYDCLLYTSDAADEGLGVDLGGRRIIKMFRIITPVTRNCLVKEFLHCSNNIDISTIRFHIPQKSIVVLQRIELWNNLLKRSFF